MPDSTIAQEWVRYATSDLLLAETVPPSGELLEHLCFRAQQTAEKAAKAVLISEGISPPKIHDVGTLLDLAASCGHPAFPDVRPAAGLTRFAVVSRYPADFGELDEDE